MTTCGDCAKCCHARCALLLLVLPSVSFFGTNGDLLMASQPFVYLYGPVDNW